MSAKRTRVMCTACTWKGQRVLPANCPEQHCGATLVPRQGKPGPKIGHRTSDRVRVYVRLRPSTVDWLRESGDVATVCADLIEKAADDAGWSKTWRAGKSGTAA